MKISGCLIFCALWLTACGGSGAPPKTEQDQSASGTTEEQSDPAKAPDAPRPAVLSETDRLMLDQAKTACKDADFKQFFEAALRSQPVRDRYFTDPVQTASRKVAVSEYQFPIQIMDYSYIVAGSEQRGPNNWEYVKLEFNQAQDERFRVDWVRVDLGPNGDDEGATPEDDREYGPRGYLLFYPTNECWALVEEGLE